MKAVIIKELGKAELVEIKEQSMRPKYIKVKTVAVGLNPSTYSRAIEASARLTDEHS